MYNFDYVSRKEYQPVKNKLISLINLVQDDVREHFTFKYKFIGSSSRNMVTCDKSTNIGYDFDVNLVINDKDEEFNAKKIKEILFDAFNKHMKKFYYNKIEDSKRVITIKTVDHKNSCIVHSCDFAIVNDYLDKHGYECQEFISHNKKNDTYLWEEQPDGFYMLPEKEDWLKGNNLWEDVRKHYLLKKNNNTNPQKKSRSLYAEAVHDIYKRNNGPKLY